MLPNRTTDGTGAVTTQDEPERPTIAGRALRALRTTRAPAEVAEPDAAPPLAEPEVSEPAAVQPGVDDPGTSAPVGLVSLVKAPRSAPGAPPRRRNALVIASAVVVAAALTYAIVGLVVYLRGTASSESTAATARDDALTAARIDIATLNTLDYRSVKAGLQQWLNVTTGDFHTSIQNAMGQQASVIAQAKRTTVGKVIAAAVTELDATRGTASVIATVDRTITPAGGTTSLDRNRYRANLVRDHSVWKIADLEIVQVGLS